MSYNAMLFRMLMPSIISLIIVLVLCAVLLYVCFRIRLAILHFIADEILYVKHNWDKM